MNFRAVAKMLGIVLMIVSVFLMISAGVGLGYDEKEAMWSFVAAAAVSFLTGGLLAFVFRDATHDQNGRPKYYRREGLATVGLAWIVAGAAGALPYLFSGTLTSFVDAYFESVSGWTTTGSTIMSGEQIDGMSHAIAFWRCFSQWLGGFGIVMVFVVLFPTGGRSLFRSEVPGVSREAAHQRVRDSAIMLAKIYYLLSTGLLITLLSVGMEPFDAVIHTFSTIANGGFSNHSESIAYYDSGLIEIVLVAFMLLSALNFTIYDALLRGGPKGRIKPAWNRFYGSLEARLFLGIVAFSTLSIGAVLWHTEGLPEYGSPLLALRDSLFQVVCVITTAGFATEDFDAWPQYCRILLMLIAISGACAGSTAGGLKIVRVVIMVKAAFVSVRKMARPRVIDQVRVDGETLDEGVVASVTGYFVLWVAVFLAATTVLASFGTDLETSATAVIATLNNVGPGLGQVGPVQNFAGLHEVSKMVLSLCMVLGRLEFYALVVLLMPTFWKR
ncbi:Trk system potassium uptake protein TrkH [Planctomycetes bacterium Poly30]|uniref:Trk system potassium uptake protein TrkH n=1 Tax=Saltatorellus ferox TaxID=2528018 RepID=A0A518EV23_9BACT|nr:Trk system potassium uptake protein TrkH [Planctomycetes bacterium Poly30]